MNEVCLCKSMFSERNGKTIHFLNLFMVVIKNKKTAKKKTARHTSMIVGSWPAEVKSSD